VPPRAKGKHKPGINLENGELHSIDFTHPGGAMRNKAVNEE